MSVSNPQVIEMDVRAAYNAATLLMLGWYTPLTLLDVYGDPSLEYVLMHNGAGFTSSPVACCRDCFLDGYSGEYDVWLRPEPSMALPDVSLECSYCTSTLK